MAVAPGPHASCRATDPVLPDVRSRGFAPIDESERRALDARCAQVGRPILPPSRRGRPARAAPARRDVEHARRARRRALRSSRRCDAARRTRPRPTPSWCCCRKSCDRCRSQRVPATAAVETGSTGVQDIPSLVSRLGWHLAYLPGRRNRLRPDGATGADRGVAILSSLPLSAPRSHRVADRATAARGAVRRSCTARCRTAVPGGCASSACTSRTALAHGASGPGPAPHARARPKRSSTRCRCRLRRMRRCPARPRGR